MSYHLLAGFVLEPGREYTRTSEEEVHLSLAAIESRSEFGELILQIDLRWHFPRSRKPEDIILKTCVMCGFSSIYIYYVQVTVGDIKAKMNSVFL